MFNLSDIVNEADDLSIKITNATGDKKAKLYTRLQQILIKLQDLNDEKIHNGQVLSEMIETKFRAVDRDFQNNVNNKQERIQSPIPSNASTLRNASIVQQVLSSLPLKNSSAPGSNMSSSTNNSASENNTNNGNGDKGAKRARRTRTETNVDVERVDVPIKTEPSTVCNVFLIGTDKLSKTRFQSKQAAPAIQAAVASVKKPASASVAGKKKNNKRKASGRQSGGQSTQIVPEPVAGAIQDDTIDPDEETYCLCGQVMWRPR